MEKYCRAGKATFGNMAHAHWISANKGNTHTHTHTHTLLFYCNSGCTDVPQCYEIHTLPVMLLSVLLLYEPFLYRSPAQYATSDSAVALYSFGSRYPLTFCFNLFHVMASLLQITVALYVTQTVNLI